MPARADKVERWVINRSDWASASRPPSLTSRLGVSSAPRRWASRSSDSTPIPKVAPDDIDTRSLASVSRASPQPPLTSPITQSSGTNTSSKNTSLNMAAPVSSRSGRMSSPGVRMSTMK